MKLIVGLGNPEPKYDGTRHNTGFRFVDSFLKKNNYILKKEKFNGLYDIFDYKQEKIIVLKPQSYMNLSGEVVKKFVDYFKIRIEDIIIIHDDIDIPCGKLRIRYKGSSGGHNGLKNIALHLGTNEYKRIKIGVNNENKKDVIDFVLGKFNEEDNKKIDLLCENAKTIIDDYLNDSFENFMNKYN